NFMSRRGVEEGSITLHAAGAPHGPQPGAVEASLGKTSTDEIAVMVDTFKPLLLSEQTPAIEDENYYRSWIDKPEDEHGDDDGGNFAPDEHVPLDFPHPPLTELERRVIVRRCELRALAHQ